MVRAGPRNYILGAADGYPSKLVYTTGRVGKKDDLRDDLRDGLLACLACTCSRIILVPAEQERTSSPRPMPPWNEQYRTVAGEGEGGVSVAAAQARQSSTVIEQGCLRDATSFIYGPSEEGEGRHKRGPGGLRRPCFQMGREGGLERGPPPLLRRTCLDLCCCLFLHFDAQEPSLHISFFWGLLGDAGGLPSDKGEY